MKNIKIFPKEWLQLHPYKQSSPVDSYYTGIANRIYAILVRTELSNSFEQEECSQVCIRMAAYFEDVISSTGIWRAFILKYNEIYGKPLPFYTPDDHYYDDEVNLEDVRFLIWHFTQQYHGERQSAFVNPDNPAQESAAKAIYQLFCDEWTTAPENEKMQLLFAVETRYEGKEEYDQLLYWFHYGMYLFTDGNKELTEAVKGLFQQHPDADKNQAIMGMYESLAYMSKTPFMGYTSAQWLALILPETHPDHNFFVEAVRGIQEFNDKQLEVRKEADAESYRKFRAVAGEQPLVYLSGKEALKDFLQDKVGIEAEYVKRLPNEISYNKLALYATPQEGLQIIFQDVELIKDAQNPFYNESLAAQQALGFFIVKHCSIHLLKELVERGMLADAQTRSLISPERGKSIVHDNWQFLASYFQREDMTTCAS